MPEEINQLAKMLAEETTTEDESMTLDEDGNLTDPKEEKDKNLPLDVLTMSDFQKKFSTDKENRQYTDWAWFVYDNYVKGNHFVKYNDITQMVEAVKATNTRFSINKVWTTLRSVLSFVTKVDPKWYVFPENVSEEAIKEAHYKQKLLDDRWIFGNLKKLTKQNVFQGLKYSVGLMELVWNKKTQDVEYMGLDPYDLYFGGPAVPDCTRITKTVWRTKEDIDNDPKYKQKAGELTTNENQFVSTWKQTLNDSFYGHQNKTEGDEGSIVYEMHYIVNKKNSLGGMVNIATFTDSTFLRHIETKYDSLWDIFKIYKTDDNLGETYGEGWVKNLIPPQKMLEILEGVTAEYHQMFAKGRYVVSKNSGAKIITNENGTIIEHNPGRRPIIENAPSMAASVDNQINRANIYLEDIGGQHDASIGRLPSGASAGIAIEALQEGDANNLKGLVENYNMFLTDVAYGTLKMYAKNLKTTKIVATDDKDKDGKPDFFAIIGEDAGTIPEIVTYKSKEIPVCVIRVKEKIRVSVDSWLAYTREAKEARIYKHYTAGMISRKAALTALEYSDIDNIIGDAIREEVVAKMISEGVPQPGEQPVSNAGGQATPPPETETAGAMSEGAGIPMPM